MKKYIFGITFAVVLLVAQQGHTYFEGMRPCTRAVGMGEAFIGVADDANALYYNPAGLAQLDKVQVPMNYTKLFSGLDLGGISQMYIALAGPVLGYEAYGSWGFSWYRRSADMVLNEDGAGETTTLNLLDENMVHLSWGRHIPVSFVVPKWDKKINLKKMYAGLSVKIPFYRFGNELALAGGENSYFDKTYGHAGFGIDASILYYPEMFKDMTLGIMIKDLLKTRMDMQENNAAFDKVESTVGFGWSYVANNMLVKEITWRQFRVPSFTINGLRLATDAVFSTRKMAYHHIHMGVEKWSRAHEQDFAFRTGFKIGARDYLFYALGGSYRYFLPRPYGGLPFKYGFQFDYAFTVPLSGIRSTYGDHSFTLTLLQGEKPDETPPVVTVVGTPERFSPDADEKVDVVQFTLSAIDESEISAWKLLIYEHQNEVISFIGTGIPPQHIVWDGTKKESEVVLANGTYTYVLVATDSEGNVGRTPQQNVELAAAALLFEIIPVTSAFSPNEDDVADNMFLNLGIDHRIKPVRWNIRMTSLESAQGEVVRTLAGKGAPSLKQMWDGRDDGGVFVPSGRYSIQLTALDAQSNRYQSPPQEVLVDYNGPEVQVVALPSVFSPDNEGNNDKTVFGITLHDPQGIAGWELLVFDPRTGEEVAQFVGDADAARTQEWHGVRGDGTTCGAGTYTCHITAYDTLGNKTFDSSATVGIGNEDPLYRVFSPNNDGIFDTVTITVPPTARPYDAVSIVFYDTEKNEVARYVLKRDDTRMTWAGKGAGTVLPDGVYTYKSIFMQAGERVDASGSKTLRIDTTPPEVAVFASPAAFSAVKGEKTTLTLQATDMSDIGTWKLEIAPDTANPFVVQQGSGKPPATTQWDGTDSEGNSAEEGGKYSVTLAATDAVGNKATSKMRSLTLFGKQKILPIDPVQFELGKAIIKQASYAVLAEAATILKESGRLPIAVYGHTDSQGNPAKNLQLSQDRAQAVVDHFVVIHGIARERFKEIKGFGDTIPIADNATREGRAQNRRTDIKLLEEE